MANRKIEVEILGDSSSLERSFGRASNSARKFNLSIGTLVKSAVVFRAVREGMDAIGGAIGGSIHEFAQQQEVAAQTQAVLKSTGAVAGVTAKHIDRLAAAVSAYSGQDDEAVKSAENLLLTFTGIRNNIGKSNKIFDKTTKTVADLAQAMGLDMKQAALQVGKALNDPERGFSRLQRIGVAFSKTQIEQIKHFSKLGDTIGAQKVILAELNKEFGGSARAFGQTIPGALARTSEAFKNMGGAIVGAVAPAVTKVANLVADALPKIQRSVSDFVDKLREADTFKAKVDIVLTTVGNVTRDIADRIGDAVRSVNWDAVWANARGIADGFQKRLEEIDFGKVGQRIGDGIAIATKKAIPAAKELAHRLSDAIAAIDTVALGKALGPGLAAAVATAFVTLTDPAFWLHNWDLALAVGLTAFGGSIGRVAGKLAAPLARFGARIPIEIAAAIERFSPRIASAVLGLFLRLPALVLRALSPLTRIVQRVFGRLGRISQFVVKVLGIQAAINAVVNMAKRIGAAFGQIGAAIKGKFDDAMDALHRKALETALKVLKALDFTIFGRHIIPGVHGLVKGIEGQLDDLAAHTQSTTTKMQNAIDGLHGKEVVITVKTVAAVHGGEGRAPGAGGPTPLTRTVNDASKAAVKAVTQQSRAERTAANVVTKDRTSTATVAERAAAAAKAAAERIQTAFDKIMASLDLNLDRAGTTKSFEDDLKALAAERRAVLNEIKIEGKTVELQGKLLDLEQKKADILKQQAQARREARTARQFEGLGLTATGEQKTPGAGALLKRVGSLQNAIKGTVLDTTKTQTQLANIAKVLSGKFGKVGRDVRQAILQMLNDIAEALKSGGDKIGGASGEITRGGIRSTQKLIKGLGLTPKQIDELRKRNLGVSGRRGFSAFGFAVSGGGGATAGATPQEFVIHSHIHLDGREIATSTKRVLQKQGRQSASGRRGRAGGRGSAL